MFACAGNSISSSVLAGQRLGIKEVDEGIWLVTFMHYDLGYFDLEQKDLANPRQPVRHQVVTHVLGTICHPCLRAGQFRSGALGGIRTPDPPICSLVLNA